MARRQAPPRRRGARRRVKGRLARLRDDKDRLEGRQARHLAGQERSCPGAKDPAGNRRAALR